MSYSIRLYDISTKGTKMTYRFNILNKQLFKNVNFIKKLSINNIIETNKL